MCAILFCVSSCVHIHPCNLQYTSIKPLGDRVLVKIKTSVAKSDGGILLPVSVQTRPQGGEVIAIGEGEVLDVTALRSVFRYVLPHS